MINDGYQVIQDCSLEIDTKASLLHVLWFSIKLKGNDTSIGIMCCSRWASGRLKLWQCCQGGEGIVLQ